MQKAAKEKSSWFWFIALALLTCAPSFASSIDVEHGKNRVELFLGDGQNGTSQQTFDTANRVENYDSAWGVASESSVAPIRTVENLPTVTFSSRTHPELAENIRHAQAAGHPSVLTHGGNAAANRATSLEGVPNIRPLSRDEYPFASSVEGGPGAWVGHVPAAQQNSQGGILSNFFRRNQIQPGDQYRVNTD